VSEEEVSLEKITLKDIENMINILAKFMKVSKKAERLLRQLRPVSASYGFGGDIFRFIMSETFKQKYKQFEELEETELTEDELKTIEKIRKKELKPVK